MFPTSTHIPFTIRVITCTKPVQQGDDRHLFTSPPIDPANFEINVIRDVFVKGKIHQRRYQENTEPLGGRHKFVEHQNLDIQALEKVWEPADGSSKGSWRQESVLKSHLLLDCAPTINVPDTLSTSVCIMNSLRNRISPNGSL